MTADQRANAMDNKLAEATQQRNADHSKILHALVTAKVCQKGDQVVAEPRAAVAADKWVTAAMKIWEISEEEARVRYKKIKQNISTEKDKPAIGSTKLPPPVSTPSIMESDDEEEENV